METKMDFQIFEKSSTNHKGQLNKAEIQDLNLDLEDLQQLDSFDLKPADHKLGMIKSLIFTAIAISVFFVPVTVGGNTDIIFGIIYNSIKDFLGNEL